MSSENNILDSSGNSTLAVLTRSEYSVTALSEDWSVADWNNGKIDFSTFTTRSGDRIPFLWFQFERGKIEKSGRSFCGTVLWGHGNVSEICQIGY